MQQIAAEKIRWRTEIIEISEEDFAQTLPMIDIDHFQVEVDRCRKSG
jgi:PleD family two-component response regulator